MTSCGDAPNDTPVRTPAGRTFDFTLADRPVTLILDDCEVFVSGAKGVRERVVTTDFYPMFSTCQREEITSDGEFVEVALGRIALGAGGCCATSGTWRTKDGRAWERRWKGKWLTVAEVEAAKEREVRERNAGIERDGKAGKDE